MRGEPRRDVLDDTGDVDEAYTRDGRVEPRAQPPDELVVDAARRLDGPLLHPPGVRDEHDEQAARAERDDLDVAYGRTAERGVLHHGHLPGELREQSHGAGDDVVEVERAVEERLDRLALR